MSHETSDHVAGVVYSAHKSSSSSIFSSSLDPLLMEKLPSHQFFGHTPDLLSVPGSSFQNESSNRFNVNSSTGEWFEKQQDSHYRIFVDEMKMFDRHLDEDHKGDLFSCVFNFEGRPNSPNGGMSTDTDYYSHGYLEPSAFSLPTEPLISSNPSGMVCRKRMSSGADALRSIETCATMSDDDFAVCSSLSRPAEDSIPSHIERHHQIEVSHSHIISLDSSASSNTEFDEISSRAHEQPKKKKSHTGSQSLEASQEAIPEVSQMRESIVSNNMNSSNQMNSSTSSSHATESYTRPSKRPRTINTNLRNQASEDHTSSFKQSPKPSPEMQPASSPTQDASSSMNQANVMQQINAAAAAARAMPLRAGLTPQLILQLQQQQAALAAVALSRSASSNQPDSSPTPITPNPAAAAIQFLRMTQQIQASQNQVANAYGGRDISITNQNSQNIISQQQSCGGAASPATPSNSPVVGPQAALLQQIMAAAAAQQQQHQFLQQLQAHIQQQAAVAAAGGKDAAGSPLPCHLNASNSPLSSPTIKPNGTPLPLQQAVMSMLMAKGAAAQQAAGNRPQAMFSPLPAAALAGLMNGSNNMNGFQQPNGSSNHQSE